MPAWEFKHCLGTADLANSARELQRDAPTRHPGCHTPCTVHAHSPHCIQGCLPQRLLRYTQCQHRPLLAGKLTLMTVHFVCGCRLFFSCVVGLRRCRPDETCGPGTQSGPGLGVMMVVAVVVVEGGGGGTMTHTVWLDDQLH